MSGFMYHVMFRNMVNPMTSFCICVIKYTIKIQLRSGQMDVFSFPPKKGDLGRTAVFKMKSKTVLRKIQNGFQKNGSRARNLLEVLLFVDF